MCIDTVDMRFGKVADVLSHHPQGVTPKDIILLFEYENPHKEVTMDAGISKTDVLWSWISSNFTLIQDSMSILSFVVAVIVTKGTEQPFGFAFDIKQLFSVYDLIKYETCWHKVISGNAASAPNNKAPELWATALQPLFEALKM